MSSPPPTAAQFSGPPDFVYLYFHYHPNETAAIVGLVVFALIDLFIILRIRSEKAPNFTIKLIPLATVETLGFVLRLVCILTGVSLAKFLIMQICMLLAPNILALMNYNTVTEIIALSNIKSNKPYLNPKKLSVFFIICTITSSIFQAVGGGIQTVASLRDTGVKLTIVGLSLQLGIFAIFSVLLAYVTRKKSLQYHVEEVENPKRGALIRIYIALTLLTLRIIYRLAQFGTGNFGPISTHEWCLYVFDSLIVAVCFLIYATLNNCFPKRGEEERILREQDEEVRDLNTLNSSVTATHKEETM
jgi:hypothetical protein